MEYIFKIEMGDPSGDGHSQSDNFFYESNYPASELKKAYKKSVKLTGVDLQSVCSEYTESKIDDSVLEKLNEEGISTAKVADYVSATDFAALIMDFIKLSMPEDFEFKKTMNKVQSIGTFGYGLYD